MSYTLLGAIFAVYAGSSVPVAINHVSVHQSLEICEVAKQEYLSGKFPDLVKQGKAKRIDESRWAECVERADNTAE